MRSQRDIVWTGNCNNNTNNPLTNIFFLFSSSLSAALTANHMSVISQCINCNGHVFTFSRWQARRASLAKPNKSLGWVDSIHSRPSDCFCWPALWKTNKYLYRLFSRFAMFTILESNVKEIHPIVKKQNKQNKYEPQGGVKGYNALQP